MATWNVGDALVGHWKCNDNAANTTVADSTANANNGVATFNTNTRSVAGRINRAFSLNGISHRVDISNR